MIVAQIAAYIIAIVAVLALSVKLLWLFLLIFTYRTYSTFISFEWFQQIGIDNHTVYFVTLSVLSIITYGLLIRFTMDIEWLRYIILAILMLWVFMNFNFSEVFLFKDYLESKGMWDINWYTNQVRELFNTDKDSYSEMFLSAIDNVFSYFTKLVNGASPNSSIE